VLLNLTLANSVGMFGLGRPPAVWEQVLWMLALSLPRQRGTASTG